MQSAHTTESSEFQYPSPSTQVTYVSSGEEDNIAPANTRTGEEVQITLRDEGAYYDLKYAVRLAFICEKSAARGVALRILIRGSRGQPVEDLIPDLVRPLKNAVRMGRVLVDIHASPTVSDPTVNLIKDALVIRAKQNPDIDPNEIVAHHDLLIGLCSTVDQAAEVGTDYYGRIDDILGEDVPEGRKEILSLIDRANRMLDLAEDVLREDERVIRRKRDVGDGMWEKDLQAVMDRGASLKKLFADRLGLPVGGDRRAD